MSGHDAISVTSLTKTFGGQRSLFGGRSHEVQAVKDVTLALRQGETLAIVGESGSGKSTLARMVVGLETPTSGKMSIAGKDAAALSAEGPKAFGQMIQYVFQDPVSSLNPRKTVGTILETPLRLLKGYDRARRQARMKQLMDAVNMPADSLERYPHEVAAHRNCAGAGSRAADHGARRAGVGTGCLGAGAGAAAA
jgi:peptide/nickel transport system ATP-binding protein